MEVQKGYLIWSRSHRQRNVRNRIQTKCLSTQKPSLLTQGCTASHILRLCATCIGLHHQDLKTISINTKWNISQKLYISLLQLYFQIFLPQRALLIKCLGSNKQQFASPMKDQWEPPKWSAIRLWLANIKGSLSSGKSTVERVIIEQDWEKSC